MLQELQTHWAAIQPYFSIRNEQDYDRAITQLNELLDEVGTDENHPMYEFMDALGTLISVYEANYYPMPATTAAEALQYLMEEHDLRQSDLSEIGSQGVVSEILNGKRDLNVRQIRALVHRFHVSPSVFI